ncbi:MAG: transcription factor FapR [Synergistaceae bacterium]|nr:transcription factor FapR [Synergistaceae bacterium]
METKNGTARESGEKTKKKARQERLAKLIEANPMATDQELAASLGVSVSTVRLDRALMGVPELRERLRAMAQKAGSKLRSLRQNEVVGELLELEPNKWALSVLRTARDMAYRLTDIVWDHYIYSQASSIAVAAVEAAVVIVDSARGVYKGHARVGDTLIARAKVGVSRDGRRIVSVHTKVEDKEIFVGRFIVEVIKS